jgi:hypothetical protein
MARTGVQFEILGDKLLRRRLDRLGRSGSRRAIVAGLRLGMTPIRKGLRRAINGAPGLSSSAKAGLRKTVGSRFGKIYKSDVREAIVGFGVGKKRKGKGRVSRGVTAGRWPDKRHGVSLWNLSWFILGTEERYIKTGPVAGRSTGRMPAFLKGFLGAVVAGSRTEAIRATRVGTRRAIIREWRKSRR